MFKTLYPNNATVQQNVDKSLHNALRNAEALLMGEYYGGWQLFTMLFNSGNLSNEVQASNTFYGLS